MLNLPHPLSSLPAASHARLFAGNICKGSIGTPVLDWGVDIASGGEWGGGRGCTSRSTSSIAPSPRTTRSVPAARLGVCVDSNGRSGLKGIDNNIGNELGGESARSKRGSLRGVMGHLSSQLFVLWWAFKDFNDVSSFQGCS